MPEKKEPKLSAPEEAILNALKFAPKSMLRWGEIKEKTGLSTRTLSLRLKDLRKKGLVKRIVDTSGDQYPPPVRYQRVGEAERKFDAAVQREWARISKRMNKMFELTSKNPKAYWKSILDTIILDSLFTLRYAVEAPSVFEAALLLKYHYETHQRLMKNAVAAAASSKEYRDVLKQIYEEARKNLEQISKQ